MSTMEAPQNTFVAQAAQLCDGTDGSYTGGAIGIFDPGAAAKKILGDVNYGELMAYCYRRFGPPNNGSDPYKELVRWALTTPMNGLFLSITIRPSETRALFAYLVDENIHSEISKSERQERDAEMMRFRDKWQQWCLQNKGEDPPLWAAYEAGIAKGTPEYSEAELKHSLYFAEFKAEIGNKDEDEVETKIECPPDASLYVQAVIALNVTIADLKRPVFVRDVAINATGKCEASYDEDPDDENVQPFHAAGYYTDPEFLENPKTWCKLQDAIRTLGQGKIGVEKALALITSDPANEVSVEPS